MAQVSDAQGPTPDDKAKRRQNQRSLAIALCLGVLVVIFYVTTLVRFCGH
jgi:hypothetical protein